MIVAVEGVSAAGKTTWCRRRAPAPTVPEATPAEPPSDDPAAVADFWVGRNARRWAAARAIEAAGAVAYCDTDP